MHQTDPDNKMIVFSLKTLERVSKDSEMHPADMLRQFKEEGWMIGLIYERLENDLREAIYLRDKVGVDAIEQCALRTGFFYSCVDMACNNKVDPCNTFYVEDEEAPLHLIKSFGLCHCDDPQLLLRGEAVQPVLSMAA
jgi:hypothetical protein